VKLFNTLGHEACHAAVWLLSRSDDNHGAVWKGWMVKCRERFPGFNLSVRHQYRIFKPFQWKCTACSNQFGRHSDVRLLASCLLPPASHGGAPQPDLTLSALQSVDTRRKVCGRCGGVLESLGRVNRAGQRVVKTANPYALFVKAMFGSLNSSLSQQEKMSEISRMWTEAKAVKSAATVVTEIVEQELEQEQEWPETQQEEELDDDGERLRQEGMRRARLARFESASASAGLAVVAAIDMT